MSSAGSGMITWRNMPTLAAVLLGLATIMAGCRSKPAPPEPGQSEARRDSADAPGAEPKKAFVRAYDVEGRLLPSDQYVAGVRLPRGCKLFLESDLRHVYRIQAPIEKVLAYLGPMMMTGKVERRGKGAIYRNANVRGAEVSPTKLDVSVLELGQGMTRISITELPPPPVYIPKAEATKAAARDTWRTLD